MKLINPTYPLSRGDFFQYTLAYFGLLVVVGLVLVATGVSGDWIWLLLGSVLFLLYLRYIVRPRLKDMSHSRWWALAILMPLIILPWWALLTPGFVISVCILWMMLTLLFFPGSQSLRQRNTKGVPKKVTVPIFIAAVLLGLVTLPLIVICPGGLFCSDWDTGEGAKAAELAVVQAAIDVMMADNALVEVTPSASGAGGEKINGMGAQFHATLELQLYIRDLPSFYCYRWQSDGLIIFQYDVNAEAKCAINGDQLFP